MAGERKRMMGGLWVLDCLRVRTKSKMAASPRSSPTARSHTKRARGMESLRERRKRPPSLQQRRPTPNLLAWSEGVEWWFVGLVWFPEIADGTPTMPPPIGTA